MEGVDGVDVNGLQSCPRRNILALFNSLKKSDASAAVKPVIS